MKEIKLTNSSLPVIVDDEDYELLSKFKWHLLNMGYAAKNGKYENGRRLPLVMMHRYILNATGGTIIDHKNGNKLDNRKSNLRFCSRSQNNSNRKKSINNLSGYKGVVIKTIVRGDKKYTHIIAQITHNGKSIYIGCYKTLIDAAMAYDDAAVKLKGEYALTNFPSK